MKKIILAITILFTLIVSTHKAQAQVSVGVNVNIGSQPVWGPVGYDYVEYYYMPDIDVYYYVPRHQYVYLSGSNWVFSLSLPVRYRYYDVYSGYKVVINEPYPYRRAESYRSQYGSYKNNHSQEVIRNSRDSRYYENKGHPEYNNWRKKNGNQGNNGNRGNNRNKNNH